MEKVKIAKDRCKGCKLCIFYCPAEVLEFSSQLNKRGVKFAKVKKKAKCTGCGFCFLVCPETCIEIYE
jgi:2-oxoglutarate ferredoxin oxidoreductase subunit delta